MNKQDTAEAIREAKLIHQSSFSEAQILLSLELFYMLGEKEQAIKELESIKEKSKFSLKLVKQTTGE